MKIKKAVYQLGENEVTIEIVEGEIVVSLSGKEGTPVATRTAADIRSDPQSSYFDTIETAVEIYGARQGKPQYPNCTQQQVAELNGEISRFAFAAAEIEAEAKAREALAVPAVIDPIIDPIVDPVVDPADPVV